MRSGVARARSRIHLPNVCLPTTLTTGGTLARWERASRPPATGRGGPLGDDFEARARDPLGEQVAVPWVDHRVPAALDDEGRCGDVRDPLVRVERGAGICLRLPACESRRTLEP